MLRVYSVDVYSVEFFFYKLDLSLVIFFFNLLYIHGPYPVCNNELLQFNGLQFLPPLGQICP